MPGGVVMVGVSHQSLPLADLERLGVRGRDVDDLATRLWRRHPEVVVLSTCSRTEIYAAARPGCSDDLVAALSGDGGVPAHLVERRTDADALGHLFRVSAGLESRIAGEVDILRQVRAATIAADERGSLGSVLRPAFSAAIATARRVHRETALGAMGRSLGRSAVDDALAAHTGLVAPTVAVAGTGKMAAAALRRLHDCGVSAMVFERRPDGAALLGVAPADRRPLDELRRALADFDVVICATSSPLPLITAADVVAAQHRPGCRLATVVDLGVPRNAHPGIATVAGVRLIDIEAISDRQCGGLDTALASAAAIVADALDRFAGAQRRRSVGEAIARLQADATSAWCEALAADGVSTTDAGEVDRLARARARRLVHECIDAVRDAPDPEDAAMWAAIRAHVMPPAVTTASERSA